MLKVTDEMLTGMRSCIENTVQLRNTVFFRCFYHSVRSH